MKLVFATTFPDFFKESAKVSIMGRAVKAGLLEVEAINLRDFTNDRHRTTDDNPFGGGAGVVLKVDPIKRMLDSLGLPEGSRTILTTPAGKVFDQQVASDLSKAPALIFLCGHYEGIDERACQLFTDWLSIGDFVMTGGEIAALAMADATVRLIPGVLGKQDSLEFESFSDSLIEYPQYTRPARHETGNAPEELQSGNHKTIEKWRRIQALKRTLLLRSDLLAGASLSKEDIETLEEIKGEILEAIGKIK